MSKLMVVAVIALVACSGAESTPATVNRTVVRLSADGSYSAKTYTLTKSERGLDVALREGMFSASPHNGIAVEGTNPITRDWSCGGSSLWMFSGAGCSGAYEICFIGIGTANLYNYCAQYNIYGNCVQNWAALTASYWPGNQSGTFDGIDATVENFNAWQACTNAGHAAGLSIGVQLYP